MIKAVPVVETATVVEIPSPTPTAVNAVPDKQPNLLQNTVGKIAGTFNQLTNFIGRKVEAVTEIQVQLPFQNQTKASVEDAAWNPTNLREVKNWTVQIAKLTILLSAPTDDYWLVRVQMVTCGSGM